MTLISVAGAAIKMISMDQVIKCNSGVTKQKMYNKHILRQIIIILS